MISLSKILIALILMSSYMLEDEFIHVGNGM
jgi:hypothetical protein